MVTLLTVPGWGSGLVPGWGSGLPLCNVPVCRWGVLQWLCDCPTLPIRRELWQKWFPYQIGVSQRVWVGCPLSHREWV